MTDQSGDQATETRPPTPFTRPHHRLCRDPDNRRIGGVASGVATYFGLEATLVRVVFVIIAAVTGGTAILVYLLAWALLAEPGGPETRLEATLRERNFVVLAVGAVLLLALFGAADSAWGGGWGWGWQRLLTPLALVGAGIVLLLHLDREKAGHDPSPTAPNAWAVSQAMGPTYPSGSTAASDPTIVIDPAEPQAGAATDPPTGPPTDPPTGPSGPTGPTGPTGPSTMVPWWAAPPAPPKRSVRPSPMLRNMTLGAACLFAAASTLLGALDTFDVSARFVLGGMLTVVAAGILVSAWWGRRRGLLAAAVLLSFALAVACVPGLSLAGGIGERVERPISVAEMPRAYRLGVGTYRIDLTDLALPTDRALRLTAGLGAGRLIIEVPRTAEVDLSGHISAGALRIDDRSVGLSGIDVDLHRRLPAESDAPHLDLRIDAAFADVEVLRAD